MPLATYYELLRDVVSFKTLHNTSSFISEADKMISWFATLFTKYHFEVQTYVVDDIPLLVARYVQNKNLPTGLIYTHYDLQVQEISSEWKNNPFNLYLGKEEIIGRGVAENKGQFMMYVTSILDLIEQGKLGYNVLFLIDGTQGKVWPNLTEFLETHRQELQADFCFCSSGSGVGGRPTIEIWQRGGINFDLVLTGNNPVLELSKLLTRFYNLNKIALPYFYYNVEKAKPETEIRRYGTNLEYRTITKSVKPNHTILDPTLDITGMITLPHFEKSYTLPKKAIANLQMYTVPHQHSQEIINGLQQWLKMLIPPHLKLEIVVHEAFDPCKFDVKNVYVQKAVALLAGAFKMPIEYKQKEVWLKNIEILQRLICPNIISLPFATQTSAIGEANESLYIEQVKKVFEFCMAFFGI